MQANKHPNEIYANIAEQTKAVFFLGTPHRGSGFSKWGAMKAEAFQPIGSNLAIIKELMYDSPLLQHLHARFVHIREGTVPVINFFELRPAVLFKPWPDLCKVMVRNFRYSWFCLHIHINI